ncbi:MAG: phosphate ABC transporter ATP-binding protein [Candidatus Methanosuratincola sp.]|nr:phosphate ABC transporter ATP-binding protein [Chloroflexota bacterium]
MVYAELRSVRKNYSGKEILKGISIEIQREDFISIVGPSGSGKTTLLKIIGGLDFPDQGEVYIGGSKLTRESAVRIRPKIGMVFQSPVLFDASVYQNVAFSLKFRGVPNELIEERVKDVLEMVQLKDLLKRNALTLSGGEAQRVALARVLVFSPELILLDEPTANLDPANVQIIEGVLRKANLEGKTIVLVTHNIFQAKRLAKRVALLFEGEMIEVQDAQSFFSAPLDPRTRRFIEGDLVY